MFSFHKPKIYRSNLGCCICKAKSSSSRFTDSNKYENEFERCFRIQEKRSGEICNACVLLVKRWKKLSAENRLTKHWHHVVDARAGPGTKLTGNRRLTSNNSSNNTSSSSTASSGDNSSNSSNDKQRTGGGGNNKSDVLPLSQVANNQSSGNMSSSSSSLNQLTNTSSSTTKGRSSALSKARAIDTNVSTFTFGEPYYRRSYMSTEHSQSGHYSASSAICKPQSALNSSAFESVIKRFRQRQQQEQLDSQRRQRNRQQRLHQRQYHQSTRSSTQPTANNNNKRVLNTANNDGDEATSDSLSGDGSSTTLANKRVKRLSECSVDVSSLLDSSIWRKEKICCGYIFRGLFNEVAVLPKLLKPCSCKMTATPTSTSNVEEQTVTMLKTKDNEDDAKQQEAGVDDELLRTMPMVESPPPRATKSGSISSCDSNTSGTGSMEPSMDEIQAIKRMASATAKQNHHNKRQQQQVAAKRPTSISTNSRQQPKNKSRSARTRATADNDSLSTSSGGKLNSPGSSSGTSSSQMMLITGEEEEDDEEEDEDEDIEEELEEDEMDDEDDEEEEDDEDEESELVLDEDESSNVDSLAEIEQNKKSSTIAMG